MTDVYTLYPLHASAFVCVWLCVCLHTHAHMSVFERNKERVVDGWEKLGVMDNKSALETQWVWL